MAVSNVLITGCSSGFGALTAFALARRGDRVFATVRRPDAERAPRERADAEGLELSVHLLDVTDADAVERSVAQVAELGDIDVLVNNAGFAFRGPVESLADDEMLRQFDANVFGVVRMVRAVVPIMRVQGSGLIINLSSIAGLVGIPFEGAELSGAGVQDLGFFYDWLIVDVILDEPKTFDPVNVQICDPGRPTTAVSGAMPRSVSRSWCGVGFGRCGAAWRDLCDWWD